MKPQILYSRNHLYFIGLIFCGLLFAFYDKYYTNLIHENGIEMQKIIINSSCRPYSKLSSSITIKHNGRTYITKIDSKKCLDYPKYSKINLLYYKETEKFYYKYENFDGNKNIKIISFILIISLVPWSRILNNLESKKKNGT